MNLSQVNATLSTRSAAVEKRVLEAYGSTLEAKFPSALTLLAVGGFGRRELFPNSDVDLLILIESENQLPSVKETLSNFLQALWDSGLRPSHSVHTVADCVTEHEQNAELTISLLDRRRLAGDAALFDTLDQKFETFIHRRGEAIARQLATLAVERRAKFQNTIYHLEPNVKDTPGGLRDLQTVRWLAILHPREVPRGLDEAFVFLSAIRIRLHEISGRDQNILTFDAQDSLSENPAELMRDYYRHARLVDRAARYAMERSSEQPGSLLGRFHDWRSRLSNSEFSVVRDQVLLRYQQHPASGFEPVRVRRAASVCGSRPIPSTGCTASSHMRPGTIGSSFSGFRTPLMACGPCRSAGLWRRSCPSGARSSS